MIRLTLVLAVWISLASLAAASLTPRRDRSSLGFDAPKLPAAKAMTEPRAQTVGGGDATEFVVTEQTMILLNGKPCRYEEVPGDAVIQRMEVAPDRKTVLKILFRSRK
jgi:hypothetical protein